MPSSVQVIGLKEATRAIKRLPEAAQREAQQVSDVTAFHVARVASAAAPTSHDGSHGHPPGHLRRSIQWQSRPRSISAIVGVSFSAFYWKFVEYGTRKMAARPFLRPAADAERRDHLVRLIAGLKRAATKIANG